MSWTANLNVKAQNRFIKSQTLATLETLFLSNYKSAANGSLEVIVLFLG